MRDTTFWPRLCLVQVASSDEAAAIDTLAPDIDLAPLFALMRDPGVLKVFHAARQDIEIFYHTSTAASPRPVFDTQVAAMVCGFRRPGGLRKAGREAGTRVDRQDPALLPTGHARPLTRRMHEYAISDVTHLRVVYEKIAAPAGAGRARGLARRGDGHAHRSGHLPSRSRGRLAQGQDPPQEAASAGRAARGYGVARSRGATPRHSAETVCSGTRR